MTLNKESLEAKQEAMRLRTEQDKKDLQGRPLCISCKRRKARYGTVYCSRCTASGMVNNLRDTLPGVKVVPDPPIEITVVPSPPIEMKIVVPEVTTEHGPPLPPVTYSVGVDVAEETYTRSQVSEMLGVSATTLIRWERKGKIPQPRRIAHNNQCVYTKEILDAARTYMNSYYEPPPASAPATPGTPQVLATRAATKTVKINKRLERAVASRLGSLGRLR